MSSYLKWVSLRQQRDESFFLSHFISFNEFSLFKFKVIIAMYVFIGLPWGLRGWKICLQWRRLGFDPCVSKIPQWREWLPTPVFMPRESHGQRSLVGYSPWGHKELDTTEQIIHVLFPFCLLFSGCFCSSSYSFVFLLLSSFVVWWLSLLLYLHFFLFIFCVFTIHRFLFLGSHEAYI